MRRIWPLLATRDPPRWPFQAHELGACELVRAMLKYSTHLHLVFTWSHDNLLRCMQLTVSEWCTKPLQIHTSHDHTATRLLFRVLKVTLILVSLMDVAICSIGTDPGQQPCCTRPPRIVVPQPYMYATVICNTSCDYLWMNDWLWN